MTRLHFQLLSKMGLPLSAEVPVEIREPDMNLVTSTVSSRSVEMLPGTYFVTTRLPAGQSISRRVQVSDAEETLSVELTLKESLTKSSGWQAFLTEAALLRESTLQDETRLEGFESRPSPTMPLTPAQVGAELRVVTGNILSGGYKTTNEWSWYSQALQGGVKRVKVEGRAAPVFAQILQPGMLPLNLALPAGPDSKCILHLLHRPEGHVTADIQVNNPQADLLLRYWENGLWREAEAMTHSAALNAEDLLRQHRNDPIAAAILAYALLRWAKLERLHDWTAYLNDQFSWLPDGVAVRGEHLARLGRHEEALAAFVELRNRGLPLFSDGVAYTVDRLRTYLGIDGEGALDQSNLSLAKDTLDKLKRFVSYVDFDRPIMTLLGLDLDAPYENVAESFEPLRAEELGDRVQPGHTLHYYPQPAREARQEEGVGKIPAARLSSAQFKRLSEAILGSYRPDDLEGLLLVELDKRIQDMVSEAASYHNTVRQVIARAQQEGWLLSLIEAAHKNRSTDPNLRTLYMELQSIDSRSSYVELPSIKQDEVADPYEVRFLRKDRPLVDQHMLRQALRSLVEDNSRILVVDGHHFSGKTYTLELIFFLRERIAELKKAKIAWVDLSDLSQRAEDIEVSAEDIAQDIAAQWGLTGMPSPEKEQESRWAVTFSDWLTGQLDNTGPQYWVVIDHFDKVLLRQSVHDLVLRLATGGYVNLPMLRIVLISYKDVDALRSKVQGDVEYEYLGWIKEEELVEFFLLEYADRWEEGKIPYSESDLKESAKESAVRVLHEVDDTNLARRWEGLRVAVAAEARQIAEQVG